jgi:RNA polymerase sigma-70 factor (sigma-E family)
VPRDFEDFVQSGSKRLLRTAHLLTGDRTEAEDLLQMTLMRVARHWRTAETAPGAYATRVLINLSRDRARRSRRRVVEAPWAGAETMPDGDEELSEQIARRALLIAALARLPDRQREVLVLRFYLDLSEPEIAAAMGIGPSTVRSTAHRALGALGRLLEEPS